jgi:cytochrome c-type protein NapB
MTRSIYFGFPVVVTLLLGTSGWAQAGVESLRGDQAVDKASTTPAAAEVKSDYSPIAKSFAEQPPLIPHAIEDFEITVSDNDCLDCHSPDKAKDTGAKAISATHYTDRDGKPTKDLAARRTFCTQCHVPQVDAKPLIDNTFEAAK